MTQLQKINTCLEIFWLKYSPIKFGMNKKIFSFSATSVMILRFKPIDKISTKFLWWKNNQLIHWAYTICIYNILKRIQRHKYNATENHSMLFTPKIDCHRSQWYQCVSSSIICQFIHFESMLGDYFFFFDVLYLAPLLVVSVHFPTEVKRLQNCIFFGLNSKINRFSTI